MRMKDVINYLGKAQKKLIPLESLEEEKMIHEQELSFKNLSEVRYNQEF